MLNMSKTSVVFRRLLPSPARSNIAATTDHGARLAPRPSKPFGSAVTHRSTVILGLQAKPT